MGGEYLANLADSLVTVMDKMAGLTCEWSEKAPQLPAITEGVTVVSLLGFTGAEKGRVVMEMDIETAQKIGEALNQEELGPFDKMIFYALSELSNIFCGAAITQINNGPRRPGLRLTPPNILVGEGLEIFGERAHLETASVFWEGGLIYIHLSLEGGAAL
ncbi:hypothetical protein GJ688_10610 [Heliobacillus mobilis]|uniref:Chemotaxis phosphatase CheX-like domain-containing protein n=1 Tax=Heliobacterium mobile TaxID=28064 RepID=A0A6I3SKF6_HELMO|nr:chemotaxis protein CheX [Heliobacterium mobile]MTV49428.1 hypothetical protein [Heliobacterium mobile]